MQGDRNADVLRHIVYYCDEINSTMKRFGNNYENFSKDSVYQNAVALCVLQIGELTTHFTEEFKNTIVELYNSGKNLTELSSEYGVAKSTITGWVKKAEPIVVDNGQSITKAEYQALMKRMSQMEQENEILKKAMAIFATRN